MIDLDQLDEGQRALYTTGFKRGWEDGHTEGYTEGYADGADATCARAIKVILRYTLHPTGHQKLPPSL